MAGLLIHAVPVRAEDAREPAITSALFPVTHTVTFEGRDVELRGYIDGAGTLKFGGFLLASHFSEGLAQVRPFVKGSFENLVGFVDASGRMVIEPGNIVSAEPFSCGMARVEVKGKSGYGFINTAGSLVIPPQFDGAESFSCDRAMVNVAGVKFFIDKSGKRLFEGMNYQPETSFSEGLARVLAPRPDQAEGPGLSQVYIDPDGKIVLDPGRQLKLPGFRAGRFSEGLASILHSEGGAYRVRYIDRDGKVVIDLGLRFSMAYPFSDGMAAVREAKTGKWGFIDRTGRVAIEPRFSPHVDHFHQGRAFVSTFESKFDFGFIDKAGKFVYSPERGSASSVGDPEWLFYRHSGSFRGGLAEINGKVINLSGQVIWPPQKRTVTAVDTPPAVDPPVVDQPAAADPPSLPALDRARVKAEFDAGNYQAVLAMVAGPAEGGDAFAQHAMGVLHQLGRGVPKDDAKAFQWYLKAAQQGDNRAQNAVADSYRYGRGVGLDLTRAMQWYRRAADRGHLSAQINLGSLYHQGGEGVAKDDVQAHTWFARAASCGRPEALYNVGLWHKNGWGGLPVDLVEACKYMKLAQKAGDPDAPAQVEALRKALTGEQLDEAEKRAADWKPASAPWQAP